MLSSRRAQHRESRTAPSRWIPALFVTGSLVVVSACGLPVPAYGAEAGDLQSQLNQGWTHYVEGNFDAALASFEQALAQDPSNDVIASFVDRVTVAKVYGMIRENDPRVSGVGRLLLDRAKATVVQKANDPEQIRAAIQDVLTSESQDQITKMIRHTALFGRNLVPFLVPLLSDSDIAKRTIAVNWIIRVGLDAVPVLQAARLHPDEAVRRNVAYLLGARDLRHVVSLATLKAFMQSDSAAGVREAAERSLRAILSDLNGQGKNLSAQEYFLRNAYEQYYLNPHRNPFASTYYSPTVYRLEGAEIVGERVADFQLSDRLAQQALEEALGLDNDFDLARILMVCNDAAQVVEYDMNVEYYSRNESQGDVKEILEKQKPYFDYVLRNRLLAPPGVLFEALLQALDDGKPDVVQKIIDTIRETEPAGKVPESLLRALEDSNSRLVRTAAAVTLAYWRDLGGFDAGQQVVDVLGDAVYSSGIYTVQKIMGDIRRANRLDATFRELSVESYSPITSVEAGYEAAVSAPPDAIFMDEAVALSVDRPGVSPVNFFVNELRKNYRTANVPVVVVVPEARLAAAEKVFSSEPRKVWTVAESAVDRLFLEKNLFPKLFKGKNDAKALATRVAAEAAKAANHLASIPTEMPIGSIATTLTKILTNRPDEVRLPSLHALGNLRAVEAAGEIADVFRRPENSKEIRVAAMRSLGKVLGGSDQAASPAVLKAIQTGMQDVDLDLRRASWYAFSNARPPAKLRYEAIVSGPPASTGAGDAAEAPGAAEAEDAGTEDAADDPLAEDPTAEDPLAEPTEDSGEDAGSE